MTTRVALHSTLLKRLQDVHALHPGDSTEQDSVAQAIRGERLEGVVCCRVDGKPRTFADVYWLVYGIGVDGRQVKTSNTRAKA